MDELKPYSYDDHTPEEWAEFLTKMHTGQRIAIDSSMYWYFLEVLPPVFMNKYRNDVPGNEGQPMKIDFGFAEGAELVTYFWSTTGETGDRYFCQQSKIMNPHS